MESQVRALGSESEGEASNQLISEEPLEEFQAEVLLWAQQFGLSQRSLNILKREGYTSLMLLSSLDKKSIPTLHLSPNAQATALALAVKYLNECRTFIEKPGPNGTPIFLPAIVLPTSAPKMHLTGEREEAASTEDLPSQGDPTTQSQEGVRRGTEAADEDPGNNLGLALDQALGSGGIHFEQGPTGPGTGGLHNQSAMSGFLSNRLLQTQAQELPPLIQNPVQTETQVGVSREANLNPNYHLEAYKNSKALHIVDFVCNDRDPRESQESVLTNNVEEDIQILCRRGPSHKKTTLSEVSHIQWTLANARIQNAMINDGSINTPQGIQDYTSYTAYITRLAAKYSWQSILIFDDEYRVAQDLEKFRWGTDCSFLRAMFLEGNSVRGQTNKPQANNRSDNPNRLGMPKNGKKGGQICHNFNYKQCKYGDSCKFRHVCLVRGCGALHRVTQHDSTKTE